jgi:hypothetical protein
MSTEERHQKIIDDPINEKYSIGKTAISDDREYKITQASIFSIFDGYCNYSHNLNLSKQGT